MYKIKTSYYYLERGFPENLEPAFTNQSPKRKRFLVERKKKILKRTIRKGLRTLVKPFFSAPTKKGVLLEKSEGFFQDVVAQVKKENLQKKVPIFSKGEKTAGDILYLREDISLKDPLHPHVYRENWEDLPNKSRDRDPLETVTGSKRDLTKRSEVAGVFSQSEKTSLFLRGKKRKQEISFLQSKEEEKGRKCRRYKFLFPLQRLKGELSKRESQYGKIELYKKQIQERKKLAFIYGTISKNSIKKLVKQARILSSGENPPAKALVTLLESRLDVALFRASFFPSISMARQWISHNKVTVNQNKIRAPGYQLKGGDCIEILPACAPLLKEKIRQRVAKILPFRRSRKKVVTPSLIENWCSFKSVFYHKESSSQSEETTSMPHFAEQNVRKGTTSQDLSIKGDKIVINPALIQNFSSMRDHLQSVWEKSVCSQPSFSHFVGEQRIKNKNHLYKRLSSSLKTNLESASPLSWSEKVSFLLQKGVILFERLKKKEVATLDFLNAKKALVQPRNRKQKLAGLQVSAIKPLHLEVSYRLLTVIFLYSPQKVAYWSNLDFSLIMRSFK